MNSLLHPVTFLVSTMSIQWVTVATVGPFSVKIAYLGLCAVVMFAMLSGRTIQAGLAFVHCNAAWVAPYATYLLILSLALYGSPGETIAPRQVLYLLAGVAFAAFLAAEPRAGTLLRLGAGLGIVLFALVVELMAQKIGLSWATAIGHFLSSGDLDYVVYSFFRAVFNSVYADGELSIKAAEKNGVAVCIFVAGLLFRVGHTRRSYDWLGLCVTAAVLFLIVMMNTRSVLLVAGASLVFAMVLRSATNRDESTGIWIAKITGALIAVILAVIVLDADHPVLGMLSDRLAFADASTEARLEQYAWVFQKIDRNLLIGSGYAAPFGRVIHNLFLSAWVHAGLIAFLLVATFYIAMAVTWACFVWKVIQRPSRWALPMPFEWAAVLPILPLFRVWLSGDAGHLFLGEWIALSAFFGLLLRNRMQLNKACHQSASPALRSLGSPGVADGRHVSN